MTSTTPLVTRESSRDLLSRPWALCVWGLAAMGTGAGFLSDSMRPLVWTISFGVAGVLCVTNAIRSKRFHCAFTGPILIIGAALTLTKSIGLLSVGWTTLEIGRAHV